MPFNLISLLFVITSLAFAVPTRLDGRIVSATADTGSDFFVFGKEKQGDGLFVQRFNSVGKFLSEERLEIDATDLFLYSALVHPDGRLFLSYGSERKGRGEILSGEGIKLLSISADFKTQKTIEISNTEHYLTSTSLAYNPEKNFIYVGALLNLHQSKAGFALIAKISDTLELGGRSYHPVESTRTQEMLGLVPFPDGKVAAVIHRHHPVDRRGHPYSVLMCNERGQPLETFGKNGWLAIAEERGPYLSDGTYLYFDRDGKNFTVEQFIFHNGVIVVFQTTFDDIGKVAKTIDFEINATVPVGPTRSRNLDVRFTGPWALANGSNEIIGSGTAVAGDLATEAKDPFVVFRAKQTLLRNRPVDCRFMRERIAKTY